MTAQPLKKLLTAAACNLSGHPVKIRWRKPARTDAKAMTFKHNGQAIIDLHPGLTWDGDTLLDVICHESAHIRQLWAEWGAGIPDYPSGSLTPSKQARNLPGVKQTESAADALAARWLAYAKTHHMKHITPGGMNDEFSLYLRTLAEMKP